MKPQSIVDFTSVPTVSEQIRDLRDNGNNESRKAQDSEKKGEFLNASELYASAGEYFLKVIESNDAQQSEYREGCGKSYSKCVAAHFLCLIYNRYGIRDIEAPLADQDSYINNFEEKIEGSPLSPLEKCQGKIQFNLELKNFFQKTNNRNKTNRIEMALARLKREEHRLLALKAWDEFKKQKTWASLETWFKETLHHGVDIVFFLYCGLVIEPIRPLVLSFFSISGFAVLYCIFDLIQKSGAASEQLHWYSHFYYSVVTFTTLGYGDLVPTAGLGQFLASLEVIPGYLMLGVLISILGKKIT